MKRIRTALAATAIAATAVTAFAAAPALAAGSVINIGHTVYSGGKIKGSGSMTNNGDYTNVCIVIMGRSGPVGPFQNYSQACKTQSGSYTWSAPDVTPNSYCTTYYTRISAYKNGTLVANKNSDMIGVC